MRQYPPGFLSLSASVACERFGFFLLASLLLLYLSQRLGFTTAQATEILGTFVAATYLSPLLVGFLTDGRLGAVSTATIGYLVAAVGYALLLAEGRWTLLFGLGLVAVGAGATKAAPQTLATRLLADTPELSDRGLTLIYLLANVSAVVSPVIGETARAWLGWPAAFALASLSLVAAWLILETQSTTLRNAERTETESTTANHCEGSRSLLLLLGLCMLSVLYSVTHMQAHSTILLWARDSTDRRLLDWELPVPYVASLHAGLVLAVAPLLARAMARLRSRPGLPAATTKIALGMAATSLAFVPLAIAALTVSRDSQAGLGWLLACLSLLSVGELLVGALGPSLVLRLAPGNSSGRWIGAWYGSTAIGFWFAGRLGSLWDHVPHTLFFTGLVALSLLGIFVSAGLARWLVRSM